MNTSVLKKCLEALSNESPDISYVRGMLETLLEMNTPVTGLGSGLTDFIQAPMSPFTQVGYPSVGKIVTTDTPEGMAVEAALASLSSGIRPKMDSLTIEKNITLN